MNGGDMQVGAWVRDKNPLYKGVRKLVFVAEMGGSTAFALGVLGDGTLDIHADAICELELTTPTPEELAQWREALARAGLALLEDLTDLIDNMLTYHADDTHCWYCSWPKGEHRSDCVWAKAMATVCTES